MLPLYLRDQLLMLHRGSYTLFILLPLHLITLSRRKATRIHGDHVKQRFPMFFARQKSGDEGCSTLNCRRPLGKSAGTPKR